MATVRYLRLGVFFVAYAGELLKVNMEWIRLVPSEHWCELVCRSLQDLCNVCIKGMYNTAQFTPLNKFRLSFVRNIHTEICKNCYMKILSYFSKVLKVIVKDYFGRS
jgi:hypothetical protein